MPAFAVVALNNSEAVKKAVTAQYGANHFELSSNAWLVSDGGTTKTVSEKLGLSGGALGAQGIVMRFSGYSGFAPKTAWTWLEAFPEAVANA